MTNTFTEGIIKTHKERLSQRHENTQQVAMQLASAEDPRVMKLTLRGGEESLEIRNDN